MWLRGLRAWPASPQVACHDEYFPRERSMPDRSSHQGPPEEWDHGSHAARGPFSAPAESDGYSNGTTGSHRARTADGHGTGPTDAYGATGADPLGTRADSFGAFAIRADSRSAGATGTFGVTPAGTFGAGAAGTFGAGAAGTFGAG